jgi:thioredoxin-like negative regulator of GroEL
VSLANRIALATRQVRAVCVEANEFPRLSSQFGVRSVPHTVINRRGAFIGALPEAQFVAATLQAAGIKPAESDADEAGESWSDL